MPPTASPLEVFFERSGKTVETDGTTPLLDLAEKHGIDIESGCRGGGCGLCKVVCLRGSVESTEWDGLESDERSDGYVLSCVACPRTNVTIRA